jgi:hypothetical protein
MAIASATGTARRPDAAPRRPQQLGQIGLDQPLAGDDIAVHDRAAQVLHHEPPGLVPFPQAAAGFLRGAAGLLPRRAAGR